MALSVAFCSFSITGFVKISTQFYLTFISLCAFDSDKHCHPYSQICQPPRDINGKKVDCSLDDDSIGN
jgi:hypothetical protein